MKLLICYLRLWFNLNCIDNEHYITNKTSEAPIIRKFRGL